MGHVNILHKGVIKLVRLTVICNGLTVIRNGLNQTIFDSGGLERRLYGPNETIFDSGRFEPLSDAKQP